MERSTTFYGKIHDFNGHGFQFAMLIYQRVKIWDPRRHHGEKACHPLEKHGETQHGYYTR